MTEPQLEIPAISLQRYFDLLKRRSWQVIPISLLGMVVGALVAFFVPRYYVATAELHYQQPPGETLSGEDPFLGIVENAVLTIPLAVAPTMKALGWTESMAADPYERRQNEIAVEKRVVVTDANARPRRQYAKLTVTYRDLDGQRAATFLNALIDTWRTSQFEEMSARARDVMHRASERLKADQSQFDSVNREANFLAKQYGFERGLPEAAVREKLKAAAEERAAWRTRRETLKVELAELQERLDTLEVTLGRTPRTVAPDDLDLLQGAEEGSEALELMKQLKVLELLLKRGMTPMHPEYASTRAMVEQLKVQLQELRGGKDGAIPNPAVAVLQAQIEATRREIAKNRAALELLEEDLGASGSTEARQDAFEKHVQLEELLHQTSKNVEESQRAHRAAMDVLAELQQRQPIDVVHSATIPPRPTEPNILVVAALGSIIGLGLAIGIVLLLDLLQSTYKTIDDVERALPVPVLGGMSYLETEEQRVQVVQSRKRASLLAGAFLLFLTALVTIYYVGPDRLPPFARNLLALVLGN